MLAWWMAAALAVPVIIDTDPGTFTDDNVAMVMCLRSPQKMRVIGITTVSGNVWAQHGVTNARRTLRVLNRRIPVHLGAQAARVHTAEMSKRQGPVEFYGAFDTPKPKPRAETAVDFLIRSLEASSDPVTILAIGPLTNIAGLIERRPDLQSRIGRLVIMGGNVHVPGNATRAAEFNFWFDPESAAIVLRSAIPNKILFGLDVCNQVVVTRPVFDAIVKVRTPVTMLYKSSFGNDFPGFLKKPEATAYLWDELAAAYLIDAAVVRKSETQFLDVITTFGPEYGKTVVRARSQGTTPVQVMLEPDAERAILLYRELLTKR